MKLLKQARKSAEGSLYRESEAVLFQSKLSDGVDGLEPETIRVLLDEARDGSPVAQHVIAELCECAGAANVAGQWFVLAAEQGFGPSLRHLAGEKVLSLV